MNRVTEAQVHPNQGLFAHMSAYLDGRIVVFGGIAKLRILPSNEVNLYYMSNRLIWTFNMENDCWKLYIVPRYQPIPPTAFHSCVAVVESDLYMFGGKLNPGEDNATFSNMLWKLHRTKTNQFIWTLITFENNASQPSPRMLSTAWEFNYKLWIYGGFGPHFDGYMLDNKAKFHQVNNREKTGFNNQIFVFDPS